MRSKLPLSVWACLGVIAAGLLAFGLPRLLRWRGGTSSLPPLSSLPPVPTPTPGTVPVPMPTPTPAPTLPQRLGQAAWLAPLRLRLEVAARAGDYLYWDKFEVRHDLRRADAIPALQSFLDDPDVFVRMRAAQLLGQVGERSGDAVLWQIAHAPEPVMVQAPDARRQKLQAQDLRDSAIYSLAKRGFKEAAPLCARSFERTGRMDFAVLAAELGDKEVIPALLADDERQHQENRHKDGHLETFGRAMVQEARALIEARFNDPHPKPDAQVKTRAAWAMIQLGERGIYYDYLLQLAKLTVEKDRVPFDGDIYSDARDALRYLATVHTPEVQALLERALDVQDQITARFALAHLCAGGWDPPSEVARQKLIFEFGRAADTPFSWNLLLELAAHSQDPEVRAAAQRACAPSPEDRESWRKAREEWVHWPGGYVYGVNMVR